MNSGHEERDSLERRTVWYFGTVANPIKFLPVYLYQPILGKYSIWEKESYKVN
jgi:hypothetical protein